MRKDIDEVLAGKMAFTPHSSCSPAGVPAFHLHGCQPMYIHSTPKEAVMISSGDKQVPNVYLDMPHSKNPKPSWYGESAGHYEGNTLACRGTFSISTLPQRQAGLALGFAQGNNGVSELL
jgi:hypothetical protein